MKRVGYIVILVALMLVVYFLLQGKQQSYSDEIVTDIQYEGADGHVYCKIHNVRFAEVDGFIPDRLLLIEYSDEFHNLTDRYPNHLSRFHCSLTKTDTYNTAHRLGFCIACETKFNTALKRDSMLQQSKSEQDIVPNP